MRRICPLTGAYERVVGALPPMGKFGRCCLPYLGPVLRMNPDRHSLSHP